MTQDVDKLEKLAKGLADLVDVGEEVMKDGKIDFSDVTALPKLSEPVKNIYEAVKAYKEMGEEVKDMDAAEAIKIVTALLS
jgi:hypothetical protein